MRGPFKGGYLPRCRQPLGVGSPGRRPRRWSARACTAWPGSRTTGVAGSRRRPWTARRLCRWVVARRCPDPPGPRRRLGHRAGL